MLTLNIPACPQKTVLHSSKSHTLHKTLTTTQVHYSVERNLPCLPTHEKCNWMCAFDYIKLSKYVCDKEEVLEVHEEMNKSFFCPQLFSQAKTSPHMTFHCYSLLLNKAFKFACRYWLAVTLPLDGIRWVDVSHLCKLDLVVYSAVWSAGKRSLGTRSSSACCSARLIQIMWLGFKLQHSTCSCSL